MVPEEEVGVPAPRWQRKARRCETQLPYGAKAAAGVAFIQDQDGPGVRLKGAKGKR